MLRAKAFITAGLVAALATACGHSTTRVKGASASPTTTTTVSPSQSQASGGSSRSAPTTAPRVAAGGSTATPPPTAGGSSGGAGASTTTSTLPDGAFHSTTTVGKKCVKPGETETIAVTTIPNAVVTWIINYSDGKGHDNSGGGIADGKGKFNDQFVVNPSAPPGKAIVYVTTGTKASGPSFSNATFTVNC